MDKRQENRQSMWGGLGTVLMENKASVEKIPAFAEAVKDFTVTTAKARDEIAIADTSTDGKVAAKDAAEDLLIRSLTATCASLKAYAHKTGNAELAVKADYAPSDLFNMRDTELEDTTAIIIGLADEHAADLVAHGTTAEKLATLKQRSTAYSDSLKGQSSGSATRGSSRQTAAELVARVGSIIENQLDQYIEQFAEDDPKFYKAYWIARNIRHLGIRHKQKETPATNAAAATTASAVPAEAAKS
jgi:hypothetical protein